MKDRWQPQYRLVAPIRGLFHRFAYMGLVLAAAALMMLAKADTLLLERVRTQVTDTMAPILDVISRPLASAQRVADEIRAMSNLYAENARLRAERSRLLQWQEVARRLEAENGAFREMLNFKPSPEASFITARVIADTGGAFVNTLVVNVGAREGISNGQAVLTGEGLIGRIYGVGARSSRVLLITDLNSRIPVLVEETGTRAILAGDNTDRPRLIHLPGNARVSEGDRIVSSGHGGAFPPRLPVGIVASVSDNAIEIQPFVDRNRVDYVRIVNYGLDGILQVPRTSDGAGRKSPR